MVIMSGMHEQALNQVLHCKASFESLGYDVLICKGLGTPSTCVQPPAGSGMSTLVTWGAVALPKIVSVLERQGVAPSDLFVFCEDSCLPTEDSPPERLSKSLTRTCGVGQ